MHELSIAKALVGLVAEHMPPDSRLQSVSVRVGPMQAIVPEAMQNAWRAATHDTGLANAKLVIDYRPWTLTCRACGRKWTSREPYGPCVCGSDRSALCGSDEITLMAIDVAENEAWDQTQARTPSSEEASVSSRELVR